MIINSWKSFTKRTQKESTSGRNESIKDDKEALKVNKTSINLEIELIEVEIDKRSIEVEEQWECSLKVVKEAIKEANSQ